MIDVEQLKALGWDPRLIDEVNRVAEALNRQAHGMPMFREVEVVSQSGSMLRIDPNSVPSAAWELRAVSTDR